MDKKRQKAVYIGNRPLNIKRPSLSEGLQNAKQELSKAFDFFTGKKKKKKDEVNG